MKRYDAFYKDDDKNGHMYNDDGTHYATEVRFVIIAESESRALELIGEQGEDPDHMYLEETSGVKDQSGRYFPESIRDARLFT